MKKVTVKRVVVFLTMLALILGTIAPITVNAAVSPKKITLSTTQKTMYVGETYKLSVKSVSPSNASKSVKYSSSNSKVATVSSTGKITAKKTGTATITVSSKANSKVKATCKVTVKAKPTKITLTATSKTLVVGDTYTLKVKSMSPSNAYKEVKFSSLNTGVATVSSTGKITAKKAGTATITVTSKANSKVKATCKVTVKAKPTKITLAATSGTIAVGGTYTIKIKSFSPSSAYNEVKYTSSNTGVATVSSTGKITGKKAGTATITVTSKVNGKVKATFKVTVKNKPTKITLAETSKTILPGGTYTIKIKSFSPSNAYDAVKYTSSNTGVATVSSTGKITAKKAGTATITVASAVNGNVKATFKVTVKNKPIAITLVATSKTMVVGEKYSLKIKSITPSGAYSEVNYASSNTSVATVSSTGLITAKKAGTATITVSSKVNSNVKATFKVTVKNPVVDVIGIRLDKTKVIVKANAGTITLKATVAPSNATNKTVSWKSADEKVATVSNGVVTIKGEGKTVITATAGKYSATCEVTVIGKTEAKTEDDGFYYFSLDKKAEGYLVQYKDKESSISAADLETDVLNFKDYWVLNSDTKLNVLDIFNSDEINELIKLVEDTNTKEALKSIADFSIVTNADKTKTVTVAKADGTKTIKTNISMEAATDGTYTMHVTQIGGNERKVDVTGITRTFAEGNTTFTATVKDYDLKIYVNEDASKIEVKRVINDNENLVASYVEEENTYSVKVNKTYYTELMGRLDVPYSIEDVTAWNIYVPATAN